MISVGDSLVTFEIKDVSNVLEVKAEWEPVNFIFSSNKLGLIEVFSS